jgi:hypothetical protein
MESTVNSEGQLDRMAQKPDQWTLAWWQERFDEILKGYRGATHAMNRTIAECQQSFLAVEELRKRCDALERDRQEDRAKLGAQEASFVEMQSRVERMAEFLNQLKQAK